MKAMLEVKNLSVSFSTGENGCNQAVEDVSFPLRREKCWELSASPARENPLPRFPCWGCCHTPKPNWENKRQSGSKGGNWPGWMTKTTEKSGETASRIFSGTDVLAQPAAHD